MIFPKSLEEYEKASENTCHFDNAKLGIVKHYPHSEGWIVEGFKEKQWLYRTCFKCGYDWALWKIGVKRQA